MLAVKDALITVARGAAFEKLAKASSTAVKEEALEVKALVDNPSLWCKMALTHDVLKCVVIAARFFDTASQFAACHVFRFYAALPESFKLAMAKPEYSEVARNNKDFCESLADILIDRWDRFHKPVFSAALLLCVNNRQFVCDMKANDDDEFTTVKAEAVAVMGLMFRRWDPTTAEPRAKPLGVTDPLVSQFEREVEDELEDFLDGAGVWANFPFHSHIGHATDPARFWDHKAVKASKLRFFALKITSLNPTTSRDERLHKKFAMNRTKTRVRLRFTVNQSLAFVNDQLQRETSAKGSGMTWTEQVKRLEAFMAVSDEDEANLEKLVAQWAAEEAKEEDAAEGTADEGTEPAAAGDAEDSVDDSAAAPSLATPPPVSMSSRGRIRKRKTFGDDFARLDDDGAPE